MRALVALRRLAESARLGLSIAVGVAAYLTTVYGFGASLGIGGVVGVMALLGVMLGVGALFQAAERADRRNTNRRESILWEGAARDADPVIHFHIRQWRGEQNRILTLPPFAHRTAADPLASGLSQRRFVIVKGDRPSGKSRLLRQVLVEQSRQDIVITNRAPVSARPDPLLALMSEAGGLVGVDDSTVIVVRDSVSRIIDRDFTADLVGSWLEKHSRAAIVITLNPTDLDRIRKVGSEPIQELERLERIAQVVPVGSRLQGAELDSARARFPGLTLEQLEWLPSFLSSANPLRERFTGSTHNVRALGHAIVCAIADWHRGGLLRPASRRYIRAAVSNYGAQAADATFGDELLWACSPVDSINSLVSWRRMGEDEGYVADSIVLDAVEAERGRALPAAVWNCIRDEIEADEREGRDRSKIVDDLAALGAAALERGHTTFAESVLDEAQRKADGVARDHIVQVLETFSDGGSAPALVSSRATDSVRRRVTYAEPWVSAASDAGDHETMQQRATKAIYSRRVARAVARVSALVLFDSTSIALGLLTGLAIRAAAENDALAAALREFSDVFWFWIAVGVFLFVLIGAYRSDSPRARLSLILITMGVLAAIGFVTGSGGEPRFADAYAAMGGSLVTGIACYRFRVRYDKTSRRWVYRNGLQARTLLIGSSERVAAARESLDTISRPIHIVGHVALSSEDWLGTVAELESVIRAEEVGRVIIVDDAFSPGERQAIADLCHQDEVQVEAIPTLAEIRAGIGEFIAGQSIVLMRIVPLWPSNAAFFTKRLFDMLCAITVIATTFPLWVPLVVSLRIRFGGALERSRRPGIGGRPFEMFRFRTAPGVKTPDDDERDFSWEAAKGMSRWMRQRGIDELPQLLNVLFGDMSIVGPRPLRWSDYAKLTREERLRYVVRPGMTGPWLVAGHTKLAPSELAALDFAYLARWSLLADFEILVKTVGLMLLSRTQEPEVSPSGEGAGKS